MYTGNKPIFACEFTIHFNVKYKVALDLLEYNEKLSFYSLLNSQALFPLKQTIYIKHPTFNRYHTDVITHLIVYL